MLCCATGTLAKSWAMKNYASKGSVIEVKKLTKSHGWIHKTELGQEAHVREKRLHIEIDSIDAVNNPEGLTVPRFCEYGMDRGR